MDKEQREHEAKLKRTEDERRESGENRSGPDVDENDSLKDGDQSIDSSFAENTVERTSSETFNAGGNDSDYDGGHPTDATSTSEGRINSNSTDPKENE